MVHVLDRSVRPDDRPAHPRRPHVDHQDAHGQGTTPNGLAKPELARVEDAVGVERVLHRPRMSKLLPSASAMKRLRLMPMPWW